MSLIKDYLDLRLDTFKEQIMAEFEDKVAEINSSVAAAEDRVMAVVAQLRAEIADAKAQGVTPERLAALDAIDQRVDAIDPTKAATLPEGEQPTDPAVPPAE